MIYLFLRTTSWMKATLLAGKLLKAIVTNCFTVFASKVYEHECMHDLSETLCIIFSVIS